MQTQMPVTSELKERKQQLEFVATQLKKEFMGIDHIIDQIIHSITSWYMLPHLQERPVVINLWGMTGVGKSSLVKRLSELLKFNKRFFHYDMGELNGKEMYMKKDLIGLFCAPSPIPAILVFDEFQLARSINEEQKEIENSAMRIVWEIIDTGKFESINFTYWGIDKLIEVIRSFNSAVKKGVKGQKGYVTEGHKIYIEEMYTNERERRPKPDKEKAPVSMIPKDLIEELYEFSKYEYENISEFWAAIYSMNEKETLSFLKNCLENITAPRTYDCSKTIIFVMGNLDEAYRIASNITSEIDADEFHQQSLKININDIKNALKHRFRNEQIARLGNTHIIYPALNKNTYLQIIQLELDKISQRVLQKSGIQITYDSSVVQFIYREGVFPTQGTRPVFTTIHHSIGAQVGNIILEAGDDLQDVQFIELSYSHKEILCTYYFKSKRKKKYSYTVSTQVINLQRNNCDDMQALIAVHESGHAVLSMMLMDIVPQCIYSSTADRNTQGFVYSNLENLILNKYMAKRFLATMLGGIAAEQIIFGDEYLSVGSADDIRVATEAAAAFVKHEGMGSALGFYSVESVQTSKFIFDPTYELNNEIKTWLAEAMELAIESLQQHREFLLTMSNFLSDNRSMDKKMAERMLKDYLLQKGISKKELKPKLNYREKLKNTSAIPTQLLQLHPWQMNKSKK